MQQVAVAAGWPQIDVLLHVFEVALLAVVIYKLRKSRKAIVAFMDMINELNRQTERVRARNEEWEPVA